MEEEGKESEQVSDHFMCAVCLDLLYKPIVLVCGHVTCLWCCYQSMDKRGQSHCPLCRHPYRHFPAICRTLDIFLNKMYPISYDRRKKQTLDDEQQNSLGFALDEELSIVDQPSEDNLTASTSSADENKSNDGKSGGGYCYKQVTVADVLCTACKQLLFQPVALNCGHVYCEACITIPEDGVIKCHSCECQHPSGFPNVCKELDYVLEEQFPSEYTLRKSSTQLSQKRNLFEVNEQGSEFAYPSGENFLQWWAVHGSKYHPGHGCDMCGMCPIIGDRYECKDCKGKRSYDLCGDCQKTGRKVPGRFNQKHTSQHRLEMVKAVINQDVIYRLLSGQLALLSASRNPTLEFASSSLDVDGDGPTESAIDSRGQSSNQTAV
ncbi:E3 ubiquitin-protein ligase PRT1 isoform X2 [Helianthus annuus]|uniref:E3 ubiquitin-protein ligase PRT1 isoform X2 n=1 Tax=Helianthus annuus TaxID=4232 RepID=UPI000B904C54|nr:E3 ubiquitin-protein ligase PRT1 isoform X2 [Helianthus annuus]XP_035835616.1 E3 ubiquitin-protein ligase PRT1 isoform X2 [Helianthus annuus]